MAQPGEHDERVPIAFISHHSSQVEEARHLVRILERNGIKGWMAPDDIDPGMPFDRVIVEQIEQSDLILLLFCAKSDQSRHVKREIMLAEQHDKLIYPIRLESIQPDGLAYWLQEYQWIDWLDRRDEVIDRMVSTIRRQLKLKPHVAGETSDAAAVQTPPVSPPPAPPIAEPPPAAPPRAAPAGDPQSQHAAQGGANDPARKQLFPGLDKKALFVLVPVGLFFLLGIVGLSMSEVEEAGLDDPAYFDPGSEEPQAFTGSVGPKLKPGMWDSRFELVDYDTNIPGMTKEMVSQMAGEMASQECLTSAEANAPGRALMVELGQMGNCTPGDISFEDGYVSGGMACTQNDGSASSQIDLDGTYTSEVINLEMDASQVMSNMGQQFEMNYTLQMVSRRTGDCR